MASGELIRCEGCGQTFPRNSPLGPRPKHCPACKAEIRREINARYHRNRGRDRKLRLAYRISVEDYEAQLEAQGGKCQICDRKPTGTVHNESELVVDHDHQTNQVRGLLCQSCNRGLGHFEDNPELIERAAAYLRFWNDLRPGQE